MFDAKGSNAESDEFVAQAAAKSKLAGNSRQNDVEIGKFLLELYQKALHMPEKELYDYFLDHAVGLTQSTIGFFHFVSDDQKSIILTTWNKEALRNCTASYTTHYSIDQAGNWADCVRLSRPIIYNDFPQSPNQKGLPEGHVSIRRIMSIPLLEDGKVQIIFGVGNKIDPYAEDDVIQLELVANELGKILKQRRSENALRESEEKYRRQFEESRDAIFLAEAETGIIVDCNIAACILVGREKSEIVGHHQSILHPPDEIGKNGVSATFKLHLGEKAGQILESKIITRNGEITTVEIKASPFEVGGRKLVEGVFRDITEAKNAEAALRETEKDLNRAQAVAKTGSWRLDVNRNVLLWSDENHLIFGIPKGTSMTYETFLGTVHPDDRAYVDAKWNAGLQGEHYDIEHRIIVNGKVKWVREKAELEFNKDGQLLGGFGTTQDITELKKANERLVVSEKKYRKLYETSQDGIIARDLEARMIDCNRAYAKMLGYSKKELKNLSYKQIMPDKWHEQREKIVNEVLETGRSIVFEREYLRKDGSVFAASVRTWPLQDEEGKTIGVWSIVRDITERKQMQNKLEDYAKNLEQLVEERTRQLKDSERLATIGQTAGMVGHDIRNPLQAIMGDVYLAKSDLDSLPHGELREGLQESLEAIEKNVGYINKIVADLQDFAKPLNPVAEETDLQALIEELLANQGIPKNVQTSRQIRKSARKITADSAYMKRILGNLISNAVQAMPEGGTLTIKAFTKLGNTVMTVEDTGVGIPEEAKPKLFQPLFSTKSKGQGFGLPVCKRLVEALKGAITFESEQGKGTKFTIHIPTNKPK